MGLKAFWDFLYLDSAVRCLSTGILNFMFHPELLHDDY